jgi:hypothetical protein
VATGAEQLPPFVLTLTVPVGVPAPGEVTTTDHETWNDWPTTVGLFWMLVALVIVSVVAAALTLCPTVLLLALNEPLGV